MYMVNRVCEAKTNCSETVVNGRQRGHRLEETGGGDESNDEASKSSIALVTTSSTVLGLGGSSTGVHLSSGSSLLDFGLGLRLGVSGACSVLTEDTWLDSRVDLSGRGLGCLGLGSGGESGRSRLLRSRGLSSGSGLLSSSLYRSRGSLRHAAGGGLRRSSRGSGGSRGGRSGRLSSGADNDFLGGCRLGFSSARGLSLSNGNLNVHRVRVVIRVIARAGTTAAGRESNNLSSLALRDSNDTEG